MQEPIFSPDRHRLTLESTRKLIRESREMRRGVINLVDESRAMIDSSHFDFDKRRAVIERQRVAIEMFYDECRDNND